jgi:hypothetical protein
LSKTSFDEFERPEQYKFIFICGLHRSGTSPFFRMLREHPNVSGFRNTGAREDEGQHLQTVFPSARDYGGPGRFGFAPKARLTEESVLITTQNRMKLFAEWCQYWDLAKPYLLEKSPPNLIRTRFLQAVFPQSSFIVISRHPVAVSLSTLKWTDCSMDSLIEHWLHCHNLFALDRSHLRRVLEIKYEDLIRDSDSTVQQVCNFLGLIPHSPEPLDSKGNDRYFKVWRELKKDKRGRSLYRRIVAKYESRVREYGYSLDDLEEPALQQSGLWEGGKPARFARFPSDLGKSAL